MFGFGIFLRLIGWLDKFFKVANDSSYGRFISFLAFLSLIALNVSIAINPHGIFRQLALIPQVNLYLLYLILGGYSITVLKDIVRAVASSFGGKSLSDPSATSNLDPSDPILAANANAKVTKPKTVTMPAHSSKPVSPDEQIG